MQATLALPQDVLSFWFGAAGRARNDWLRADAAESAKTSEPLPDIGK
jgi:hypothetical protein